MLTRFCIYYLIGINILTFLLYGIDKWKARKSKWRISERTLIGLAICGGSIGALLGVYLFRHKTHHKKFTIGVPVIFLLQVAAVIFFLVDYGL